MCKVGKCRFINHIYTVIIQNNEAGAYRNIIVLNKLGCIAKCRCFALLSKTSYCFLIRRAYDTKGAGYILLL